jgi:hypothetical protein
MVVVHDVMLQLIWTAHFLAGQGINRFLPHGNKCYHAHTKMRRKLMATAMTAPTHPLISQHRQYFSLSSLAKRNTNGHAIESK